MEYYSSLADDEAGGREGKSVTEPFAEEAPIEMLVSPIDIDSYFILTRSLSDFRPRQCVVCIFCHYHRYESCKNKKALDELDKKLSELDRRYDRRSFKYFEVALFNYDQDRITVLFRVKRSAQCRTNYAREFMRTVVTRALSLMPDCSDARKHFVQYRRTRQDRTARVTIDEYPRLARLIDRLTSSFVDRFSDVAEVYYYKCYHGLKAQIDRVLPLVRTALVPRPRSLLFVQLHSGISIDCPFDTAMVIRYPELCRVVPSKQFCRSQSYFFIGRGYFYNLRGIGDLDGISYAHSYETIQHKFTEREFKSTSLFALAVLNGISDGCCQRWTALKRFRDRARDFMAEIKSFAVGQLTSLDMRIEVVESFDSVDSLRSENFQHVWNAALPNSTSCISLFPKFLTRLWLNGCFELVHDWHRYVVQQIGDELRLLSRLSISCGMEERLPGTTGGVNGIAAIRRYYAGSRNFLSRIYHAEQAVLGFIQGCGIRYDQNYLYRARSSSFKHQKQPRRYYTLREAPTYVRDLSRFRSLDYKELGSGGADLVCFIYKIARRSCAEEMELDSPVVFSRDLVGAGPDYELLLPSKDSVGLKMLAESLVRFLMRQLALVREYLANGKREGDRYIDYKRANPTVYFFLSPPGLGNNNNKEMMDSILLSKWDVVNSITRAGSSGVAGDNRCSSSPTPSAVAFLVMHVLGESLELAPRDSTSSSSSSSMSTTLSSEVKFALESFVERYVRYWPAYFVNSNKDVRRWHRVLGKDDIAATCRQEFPQISTMSGRVRRTMNLAQYRKAALAVVGAPQSGSSGSSNNIIGVGGVVVNVGDTWNLVEDNLLLQFAAKAASGVFEKGGGGKRDVYRRASSLLTNRSEHAVKTRLVKLAMDKSLTDLETIHGLTRAEAELLRRVFCVNRYSNRV